MALETLKELKEVGGEKLLVMDNLRELFPSKFNESGAMDYEWFEKEIRPFNFIYVRHDKNSISFTVQDGPIKENGKNGCQVDHIIMVARAIVDGLNKKKPCRENSIAITKLDEALMWLNERTRRRTLAGVEGTSQ